MGQFLTKPVTETFPEDFSNGKYAFGSSSMQGYRTSQEDAHTCLLDFDEGVLLAAVYDGHGGAEVAQYAAKKFPEFLKNNASYQNQQYERALVEAFLEFDASLIREDVLKELKVLAGDDISEAEENEDMHANLSELREEARIPIEQLLERFAKGTKKERQSKLKAQKSIEESISAGNKTDQCSSTSKTDDSSMEPCSSSSKVLENGESSTSKEVEAACSSKNGSEVTSTAAEVEASDEAGCSSSSAADSKPDKEDEPSEDQPSSSNSTEEAADKSTASDQSNEPSSTGQEKSKRIKPIKVSSQCSKSTFLQMLDEIDEEDDEEDESVEGSDEGSDEFYDSSSEDESESDEDEDDLDEEEEENEDDEEAGEKAAINGEAQNQRQHPLRRFMFDEGPGKDSGCTAVIALIKNNKLYVANAGDSRCVLSRAGQAIEMSHDHKPTNEIEYNRIKKAGGRVTSDGRVNGGLNLSRAFGDHSYKKNPELPLEEQMITALPDIKVIEITDEDDFIVLACDGIWNSMSSREVVEYINGELKREKKLSKICDSLFFKCLAEDAHSSDGSGCDNQTAIIIKLKDLPIDEENNGEAENVSSEVAAKSEANETKIVAGSGEESNGKRKRDDDQFTNGTEQLTKESSPTSKKAKSELVE